MKRIVLILIFTLGVGAIADSALANVTRKFSAARKFFERGRLKQSERVLRSIIRQYPDHKASYYLLGRIAYRSGKSKRASRLFLKSGPSFLFTGGAFEYGISMFSIKKYNLAIRGLKTVSRRSPMRGVADFYIGVAYYNQKRFAQAEIYLRRARKLPRNLETSRRAFLKEARRQRRFDRGGRFVPQRPIYIPPPTQQRPQYAPPGSPPPLPQGPGAPPPDVVEKPSAPKKPVAAKPPEVKKGFSNSYTPRFNYSQDTKTLDKHAYGLTEQTTQGVDGGLGLNFRYDNPKSTNYTLLIDLGFSNKSTTGATIKNVVFEDDPDNIIATRDATDPSQAKNATIKVNPGLTVPFSDDVTLNASFDLTMSLPDMRMSEASQSRKPAGSLELSFDDVSLDAGFSLQQKVDAEGETTDQVTTINGGVDKPFGTVSVGVDVAMTTVSDPAAASIGGFEQKLALSATASKSFGDISSKISAANTQNTPPSGVVVAGTQGSTTLSGEVSFPFDFGLSLTGGGKYVMIDQYITQLDETPEGSEEAVKVNVPASGTTTGFFLSTKFAPISWGFISASYKSDQTSFAVSDKERLEAFEQNTVDLSTGTSFAIGVSSTF